MVPTDERENKRRARETKNILPLKIIQNGNPGNINQAKLLFLREQDWLDYTMYDKEKEVPLANWREGRTELKY